MPVSSSTSRYGGFSTTYSTSFGSSASSIPRASSGGKSGLTNGFAHTSSYRSRALPTGPGPLDPHGRKLSNYSVAGGTSSPGSYEVRRNRTPSRVGPLKADHTSSFSVGATGGSRYLSDHGRAVGGGYNTSSNYRGTSTLSRPVGPTYRRTSTTSSNGTSGYDSGFKGDDGDHNHTSLRPLSGTNGRPRKSSSLADLSNLSINSNTSSNRNRPGGADRLSNDRTYGVGERAGGSSSRNSNGLGNYRDDDIFGAGRSSGLGGGGTSYLDRERPDGTSRMRYTPSMSREASPTGPAPVRRGVAMLAAETGESPTKSSLSNQSSSSSMSNGSSSSQPVSHTSHSSSSYMESPAHKAPPSRYYAGNSKYRDGGKIGLRNLGNTCFMNSVLQCLSNTRQLLDYCLEEKYHSEINTTTSNMKGSLFKAYAQLMQAMWKEKSESYVSPNAFKTQIQKFAPRFMGYAQQDSQEFLRYLLEGLHEDVNRVTKKTVPIILDDDVLEKKSDSGKAQDYWKAYLNRDNSLIVDIFVGQLKSELHFSPCRHCSVTFDPFWDLSVSIPKNRSEVNLEDCIRLFMKEEELAAEERPMCAKCKTRQSCTKSFSIQRFPKILVLHLKRFSQERFGRKLSTLVDFPTHKLDLTEYAADSGGHGSRPVLYDLYAVSNHSGGTSSGHYTAYCKNPYSGDWSFFNDARVSGARSNQAVSSEAYVLFYELCS